MRMMLVLLALVALPALAQKTVIPTQQQVDELNRHRDPRPTEQYTLRQKRLELCRKKHGQTGENVDRCMRDGE